MILSKNKFPNRRLVGFHIDFRVNVFRWELGFSKILNFVSIGPFYIQCSADYEYRRLK